MYIEGRLEYTSNYYLPHLFFLSQIKTAAYIMQFFVHTIFCSFFFFLFAWEKKKQIRGGVGISHVLASAQKQN